MVQSMDAAELALFTAFGESDSVESVASEQAVGELARNLARLFRKLDAHSEAEARERYAEYRKLSSLSPRQLEVLRDFHTGKSAGGAARDLGLRQDTIRKHASEMYRRLAVHGKSDAVVLYERWHLVIDAPSTKGE